MTQLRTKVISGVWWRGFAEVANILVQIAFTAVLARLLGLSDFGLAAMCTLFLRFVRALTDVSWFGAAIIQSQHITERQISALFMIHVLLKIGVFVACVAAAPLAADFFAQPSLVDLIRVLAISMLIDSLAFPQTLAQKQLRFRGYSLLELGATVAGGLVGIVMAFAGFGVWSLIARQLAHGAVYSAAIWPIVGWRPRYPAFQGIRKFLNFGLTLFASSTVYFFSRHLAAVVIGRLLGVEALGLYNVAYNFGIVPAQKIESALATVLTPAFASLQKSADKMRKSIHDSLFSVGALFTPMMFGLAAIAPSFVPLLYGEKWVKAGEFLIVLALVGLLKGLEHLVRSIQFATGRPKPILVVAAVEASISVPCLWLAGEYLGVWGIVSGYLAVSLVAFVLTAWYAQRAVNDSRLVVGALWRTFCAAAVMFGVVMPMNAILSQALIDTLAIQVTLGIAVYGSVRWLMLSAPERNIVRNWPLIGRLHA